MRCIFLSYYLRIIFYLYRFTLNKQMTALEENSPNFTEDGPDVEIAIVPPQEECMTDMDSKFR